jgi:hypothetical protein
MTEQETGGAPAPVTDANALAQPTEVKEPVSAAESSPAAPTESEKPKPESGEQLRIKELTRRYREEQRRSERLLRMIEERSQQPAPQPQQPPAQPKGLKDFNYDENAYREYLFTEAANKAVSVAERKAQQTLQQQQAATRRATYEARAEAFGKTVEDFDEVLQGQWACSEAMAEVIEESDEGPAVAYYLAQNPDVSRKLAISQRAPSREAGQQSPASRSDHRSRRRASDAGQHDLAGKRRDER